MRVSFASKVLVILGVLAVTPIARGVAWAQAPKPVVNPNHAGRAGYSVPLRFEPNRGQAEQKIRFLARARGYTLFLTPVEAVIKMRDGGAPGASTHPEPLTLRMRMAGANSAPRIEGEAAQSDTVSYIHGNDKNAWLTGIPTYARVRYHQVYPGVDLVYHNDGGDLEYDFVVAAGADPNRIRIEFSGAEAMLAPDGDLVLKTAAGELRQPKPVMYQEVDGRRRAIAGGFALTTNRQVRFDVGAYDRERPLVIDPVLAYSTYFGGASDDVSSDIAVDGNRNVYIVGTRPSARPQLDADAFVAKFDATGTLLWVTNVGDRCDDEGRGIAVGATGDVYVTGHIGGICYPYPTLTAGAFVAKVSTAGAGQYMFAFSDQWSGSDIGQAVAVDAAGNAYVGGVTSSSYFQTTPGVVQPHYSGWYGDGFVVKVNATGTMRLYATFLGGSGHDSLNDIVVDGNGNAYVTGSTGSFDFPTTGGAYQPTHNGWGPMTTNAFVSKLSASGAALIFSTYLGGRFNDVATSLAIDAARNVYVTGSAESDDFPTTPGVVQPQMAPQSVCMDFWQICTDAFVTKLDAAGSAVVYSTYLGAGLSDSANGIAVDAAGNAYITGSTWSTNFPTVRPFQLARGGDLDGFVTKLNATGAALVYSSYLGGGEFSSDTFSEGEDAGVRIAVDADGAGAYVTGVTRSPSFPVTPGAHQQAFGGGLCSSWQYRCADAFVVKIADTPAPATVRNYAYNGLTIAIPDNVPAGVQIPFAVANFPGTIGDLNFRIDGNGCTNLPGATTVGLTHTWVGDLVITLTSPQNTTVVLMNRAGGVNNAGDNLCQTLFDDEGGALSIQNITAAGAPYRAAFRPVGALAAFRGQNPNGTWRLTVSDGAAQDIGVVRAFTLTITGAQ